MKFKRRLFIEDLFVPKKVLNAFDWVEFESLNVFKKYVKDGLYRVKKDSICHIHIQKMEDFSYLKNLFYNKIEYFTEMKMYIEFDSEGLFKKAFRSTVDMNMDFAAIVHESFNLNELWKNNREWVKRNMIVHNFKISESTLEIDIAKLLDLYNSKNNRFFLLDIDYESFQNVTIEKLDRIEYFFYHLRTWLNERNGLSEPLEILVNRKLIRRIFVGDDLILYLDSYKDPLWSFNLSEHLEENGNIIDSKILNKLHSYLDLHTEALCTEFQIINHLLISYRQILRMGYNLNEIPIMMGLIQRWLYV